MILTDTNTQPLITIITVCYNSSRFLSQCIESVLQQDYQNFEYIILDDNSTDNTWQIIEQYKQDARIKAFRNKENIGEYNNRNKGIDLANGKYIIYVDGDDVALKTGILFAVYQMEQFPNCGLGLAKAENPKYIYPIEIKSKDALNLEFFSGASILDSSLGNNIFKTTALKNHPFLAGFKNADTYTRINLIKTNNLLIHSTHICIWRQLPSQASQKISYVEQLLQTLQFYKEYILNDSSFNFFDKKLLMPYYYRILINALKSKIKHGSFDLKKIKSFMLDKPSTIVKYLKAKPYTGYWNEYDYTNLNFSLKKMNNI